MKAAATETTQTTAMETAAATKPTTSVATSTSASTTARQRQRWREQANRRNCQQRDPSEISHPARRSLQVALAWRNRYRFHRNPRFNSPRLRQDQNSETRVTRDAISNK
jgi:hypothetical protein